MHQIEGKPVEEVIAGNPDFFDIDESEHIEILYCLVSNNFILYVEDQYRIQCLMNKVINVYFQRTSVSICCTIRWILYC